MSLYSYRVGRGPDVMLVHGWGMNAAVWSELAEVLGSDFRLHLIELPGHGGSPLQAGADLADWARACLEVAPPRAAWAGWSLGGLLALQAALSMPDRVARLVLVAATPRFVQGPDWAPAVAAQTWPFSGARIKACSAHSRASSGRSTDTISTEAAWSSRSNSRPSTIGVRLGSLHLRE